MTEKLRRKVQILLFAIAIGFLAFGLARGEAGAVLQKAVRVCLECIGIG